MGRPPGAAQRLSLEEGTFDILHTNCGTGLDAPSAPTDMRQMLSVYPGPTRGKTTIRFSFTAYSVVLVEILDVAFSHDGQCRDRELNFHRS